MRIFNEDKTIELQEKDIDLSYGYLVVDVLNKGILPAIEGLRGELKVYEDIQIFVPYTEKELAEKEIIELKQKLQDSDYKASRFTEGSLTEEEFSLTKQNRINWRLRIQELQKI